MEKVSKITAPDGCEIEKVELVDGVVTVTFKAKERVLPKNWEEFCETNPITGKEYFINDNSVLIGDVFEEERDSYEDRNILPDRATAGAVRALCQLVQLRECYNQGWKPDWNDGDEKKYLIVFIGDRIIKEEWKRSQYSPLYFKTAKLRDLFMENFRPLIEKLKPLYGIKEGGER